MRLGFVSGFLCLATVAQPTVAASPVDAFPNWQTAKQLLARTPEPWRDDVIEFELWPAAWTRVNTIPPPSAPAWRAPYPGSGYEDDWILRSIDLHPAAPGSQGEEMPCGSLLWKRFDVDEASIGFSIGRVPEDCSEAPRMIWYRRDGSIEGDVRLAPLFNMNVDSLWSTKQVIVFGLRAKFEGGESADALALWHRPTNQWFTFQIDWGKIGDVIPHWLSGSIDWSGDALYLRADDKTLTLSPFKGEWQLR
jgi:hypothetical protein